MGGHSTPLSYKNRPPWNLAPWVQFSKKIWLRGSKFHSKNYPTRGPIFPMKFGSMGTIFMKTGLGPKILIAELIQNFINSTKGWYILNITANKELFINWSKVTPNLSHVWLDILHLDNRIWHNLPITRAVWEILRVLCTHRNQQKLASTCCLKPSTKDFFFYKTSHSLEEKSLNSWRPPFLFERNFSLTLKELPSLRERQFSSQNLSHLAGKMILFWRDACLW